MLRPQDDGGPAGKKKLREHLSPDIIKDSYPVRSEGIGMDKIRVGGILSFISAS